MAHTTRFKWTLPLSVQAFRHYTAWLTAFALFVQVFVPFGHALAFDPDSGLEFQVICTPTGIKQIPLNVDGTPADPQDVEPPCPFCFTYTAPALLQPDTVATVFVSASQPPSFTHPGHARYASIWRGTPCPSRAPPLNV